MTEKLLTGTLSLNTNIQTYGISRFSYDQAYITVPSGTDVDNLVAE